jgi:cytochrome c-type biogenesis protein CcsB
MDVKLFWFSFICYFAATFLHFAYMAFNRERLSKAATLFMGLGFAFQTAAITVRTAVSGHLPLTNMFEYISTLAWFAAMVYLISAFTLKSRLIESATGPVIFILYICASLLPKEASQQLIPALQSYWLQIHVSMAAAGEAVFLVAFVSSLLYLIKSRSSPPEPGSFRDRLPSAETLDEVTYKAIMIGYPLFTLGALFAGAIWAYKAWGNFWSWDPKETCSLIVWIIYSIYLHARFTRGWRGKRAAIISIIGFIAALMTFFSNMVLGGLHSYG